MPRAEQLTIPSLYGSPSTLLSWDDVDTRLGEAKQYWVATTRPDGRPHVVPHDGLWFGERWWFGGSDTTVKHRNLLGNPAMSLHLEDAVAAVVVEGRCHIATPTQAEAEDLAARSAGKYGMAPPPEVYLQGVWCLVPRRAMAWTDVSVDATRFVFDGGQ